MDQDDSMLSTPSSNANDDTYDEDNLFPETSGTSNSYIPAQVPQNDHLNAAAPGELSPPRSSTNTQSQTQTNGFSSAPLAVDSNDISEDDEAIDMKGERSRGVRAENSKPGAGWKNKKTQEEMQRSWDNIVDREFDIRQFGDPLSGKQKRDMANNDGMDDEKQTSYRRTAGFGHLGGGKKGLVIEDFLWSYREKPSDSVLHASCAK